MLVCLMAPAGSVLLLRSRENTGGWRAAAGGLLMLGGGIPLNKPLYLVAIAARIISAAGVFWNRILRFLPSGHPCQS